LMRSQPRFVLSGPACRDVAVDRRLDQRTRTTQIANQRIGLNLSPTLTGDVVLDVGLAVIGVTRIAEVLAAAGLQVLDPRQAEVADLLVCQTDALDADRRRSKSTPLTLAQSIRFDLASCAVSPP
jgi:hypothetical protein